MADTNNIIPNGLRADVMRNKMENKDALQNPGAIYVGTGEKITIESDGKTYEIPKTEGMLLKDAIVKYGEVDSYPLSDALKPISLSDKKQLINDDGTLTKLAKNSFSYTVYSAQVKLQDAGDGKEEVIIPTWSKGMVLSSGSDLLVTYGQGEISGGFFYNQATSKWTIVKANIASILDAETVKTNSGGLIPKTSSVNLGSNDNSFNTIYANRYYLPGTVFNFKYNSDDETITQISALIGYSCIKPNGSTLPISLFEFMDGKNGLPNTEGHHTWIKAKGIRPYNNNEINFDLQGDEVENIYFGNRGSTNKITSYKFINGKDSYSGYADIVCKEMQYNSYYNPTGAPLNEPTSQDISENIKSINQRLYDLGFKQAYLVEASSSGALPEGTRLGTLERWGNVVLIKLDYNFTVIDSGRVLKPDGDAEWNSSWFNPESFNSDGTGTIVLFEAQVKDTTGSDTTVLKLKVTRVYSDSYLSLSLDSVPAVAGISNSITEGSVFAYKAKPIS